MDSMEASDWITAGLALAAVIIALLSWRASHRAAVAAEDSAGSARRSAATAEAKLEIERKDRAAADLERRLNVWDIKSVHGAVEFKFLGDEAHLVRFEAGVALRLDRKESVDVNSPMNKGDTMIVTPQAPVGRNTRVTVTWAESGAPDAERLNKLFVV